MRLGMKSDVRIHLNKVALVRGSQGSMPCRWELERSVGFPLALLALPASS